MCRSPGPRRENGDGPANFLFLGNLGQAKGVHDILSAVAAAKAKGFAGRSAWRAARRPPASGPRWKAASSSWACGTAWACSASSAARARSGPWPKPTVLLLPSYREGLPMAILEAMACGLPVIATGVGSDPEVVADGSRVLLAPGEWDALADRLLRLGQDAPLRRRMGLAARKKVESLYSLDGMVENIMGIYQAALA